MSEINEVNETPEAVNETEGMDADLLAEVDEKCSEYTDSDEAAGEPISDRQRRINELKAMKAELLKEIEAQKAADFEGDGDNDAPDAPDNPQKVLTYRRTMR